MGMSYSAVVIVGLPYEDIEDTDKVAALLDALLDDCVLDEVTPYYDGGVDKVVGLIACQSGSYDFTDFTATPERIQELVQEFMMK